MKLHTTTVTAAVSCALRLDSPEHRTGYGFEVGAIKRAGIRGRYKVTGTLDQLQALAGHMLRDSGWDLSQQTINACNKAANALYTYVRTMRAMGRE
jgi:hypothetical protein